MNAEKFFELMNTLPDDMLVSAVRSEPKRNRKPMYIVSAIAACLVIGVTAVVYPKLKVQPPEIREPDVTVTETMLVTSTAVTEASSTIPSTVSAATTVSELATSVAVSTISWAESTTQTVTTTYLTAASSQTTTSTQHSHTSPSISGTAQTTFQTESAASSHSESDTGVTYTEPEADTKPSDTGVVYIITSDLTQLSDTSVTDIEIPAWTTQTETEISNPKADCWILSETKAEDAPNFSYYDSALYRNGLPSDFAYDTVPDIDFSENDCLILRFYINGCGEETSEIILCSSTLYSLSIHSACGLPEDTAEKVVLAVSIPKRLYSEHSSKGISYISAARQLMNGNKTLFCTITSKI